MEVPGIVDEASCESAIACELPDGSIDFTLTESECRFENKTNYSKSQPHSQPHSFSERQQTTLL